MVCKSCANYKIFKEKCWYYWEGKKECSQKVEEKESKLLNLLDNKNKK